MLSNFVHHDIMQHPVIAISVTIKIMIICEMTVTFHDLHMKKDPHTGIAGYLILGMYTLNVLI